MIAETESLTELYPDSPLFAGLDERERGRLHVCLVLVQPLRP